MLLLAAALRAQSAGVLQGTVQDETGAVIPAASVTITGSAGPPRQLMTNDEGRYVSRGLPRGTYTLRAVRDGFEPFESGNIEVNGAGTVVLSVTLALSATRQQVTVSSDRFDQVSLSPSSNAGAIVLRESDLDALSDDPNELMEDLKALAGPSAGPIGIEFYIDGFSGGRLPPKNSIREVRINQNPFSAEYDRVGLGRIEILTKPGSDKFNGMVAVKDSEGTLNSRNPYAAEKAPYHSRQFNGDLGGPLSKKSSFALNYERRQADDNAVIHATVLDPQLRTELFTGAVLNPQRDDSLSGRVDYQAGEHHTFTGRYNWGRSSEENAGIGSFLLASRALTKAETAHTAQLTESSVLGPNAINEIRFQFIRSSRSRLGIDSTPSINVLDAFRGGGAQVGHSFTNQDRWELQNYTSLSLGAHMLRFGVRLRTNSLYDNSPRNFGGTFVFGGGLGPVLDANNQPLLDASGSAMLAPLSSLERYRRTLLFQRMGLPLDAIRALGGGPSQFSIVQGEPASVLRQTDVGFWVQEDWRMRSNLSLSVGLRWEAQNHIHDWHDFAPRVGLAWMPRHGKTLVRAGAGIFYDRFGEGLVLQAMRFDGRTQRQMIVDDPGFWPDVPPGAGLDQLHLPQTIRQISRDMRAPELIQTAIAFERPLLLGAVLSVTFQNLRGIHQLLSRNINAPFPGSAAHVIRGDAAWPMGRDNVYQYESAGILNRNQVSVSVNRRFNRRMSLFGTYVYGRTFSNTDGPDWFPANQYDLRSEYGRAATDVRHSAVAGSSVLTPFGLSLSPFFVARSGAPFNIVTGHDDNGDSLFTDRPSFATDFTKPGLVLTRLGAFDTRPGQGQALIPRNFGQASAFFALNVRLSRTFGFGPERARKKRAKTRKEDDVGFGGGEEKMFYDVSTGKRYNLTLAVIIRNVLNRDNAGLPVGNLASPYFGQSNWLASSASPDDPSYGNNRRIQFQTRLTF